MNEYKIIIKVYGGLFRPDYSQIEFISANSASEALKILKEKFKKEIDEVKFWGWTVSFDVIKM